MDDNELRWMAAIKAWFAHDREPLAAAIADETLPLSPEARLFLADLVQGSVRKRKGRPPKYTGRIQRVIGAKVFVEWERLNSLPDTGDPQQQACEFVAEELGMTDGQIRGVVERLGTEENMTLDAWQSIGRPRWDLEPI